MITYNKRIFSKGYGSPERVQEIGDYCKKHGYDKTVANFKLKPKTIKRYITEYNYYFDESVICYSDLYCKYEMYGTQNSVVKILNYYFDNKCNEEQTLKYFNIKKRTLKNYLKWYFTLK